MMMDNLFKRFSISIITFWLIFFALLPFLFVAITSFLSQGETTIVVFSFSIKNYLDVFHLIYLNIFLRSFFLASIATLCCLLLGYPFAYIVAKSKTKCKIVFVFLIIVPFWTSSLIRVYSMETIISVNGILNRFLLHIGIISHPAQILYTQSAVLLGLVYDLLPFMILPIYANLEKFDWKLIEAARDLGATKKRIFARILIPMSMSGIISGILLVFLPAITLFYIPDILGGAKSILLGNLIKNQFIEANNWPSGCAISIILTLIIGLLVAGYWKVTTAKQRQELL